MNTLLSEYIEPPPTGSILDNAVNAPTLLIEASVADKSDYARPTGLILTKDQIIGLKKYELAGLALPIELADVISYLGYRHGAGLGLEADDFLKSFKLIHTHARRWQPLQEKLRAIGSELKIFAGQMIVYGDSMQSLIEAIKAGKFIEANNIQTVEELAKVKLDMGDRFPGIDLDEGDRNDVRYLLEKIIKIIRERNEDASEIKNQLDEFGQDLAYYVLPEIRRKIITIDNSSLTDTIRKLNDDIERRATDIDVQIKAYKDAVQMSLSSVGKFNVVGLALGIYYGVEAESVRAARNEMMAAQARDIALLQSKNSILGSLNKVKFDLQNLDTIVIDADIATKNLITVWNSLALYAEKSLEEAEQITDGLKLKWFINQFNLVVSPWKNIAHDAERLNDVFKQADHEFKRIRGQ